jgi:hypothetical protein
LFKPGPGQPPLGVFSNGWTASGSGFGAVFVVPLAHPTTAKTFRATVYSPGRNNRGSAVAYLHPTGDTGFWYGYADLGADTKRGWHKVGALDLNLTWAHYPDATSPPDRTGYSDTLAHFSTTYAGGDGEGAEVGFLFGCNDTTYFLDSIAAGDASSTKVFDFGGVRTRTSQSVGGATPDRKVITYGKMLAFKGYSREKARDRAVGTTLSFQKRKLTGGDFSTYAKGKTGADGRASASSTASTSSRFRIRSAGDKTHEPSTSRVITVVVRMNVRASLADSTVVKGHPWHVRGHVGPNKRTTVLLQRIVNGKWATFKRGHSARNGDYAFTGTATSTGQRYFRVLARGGRGNADGLSNHVLLKVVKPSGGGGGTTPPDPPDDPTPPPPPPPEGFLP